MREKRSFCSIHGQRLAQVARMVGVDTSGDAHVVGDELRREGQEDRGQEAVGLGDDQVIVDIGAQRGVFGGDRNRPAATGGDFVDVVDHHRFVAGGGDEQNRVALADGGKRTMLELAGKDAFAVGVGDRFELECAFEGDGMSQTKTKVVWGRTD